MDVGGIWLCCLTATIWPPQGLFRQAWILQSTLLSSYFHFQSSWDCTCLLRRRSALLLSLQRVFCKYNIRIWTMKRPAEECWIFLYSFSHSFYFSQTSLSCWHVSFPSALVASLLTVHYRILIVYSTDSSWAGAQTYICMLVKPFCASWHAGADNAGTDKQKSTWHLL